MKLRKPRILGMGVQLTSRVAVFMGMCAVVCVAYGDGAVFNIKDGVTDWTVRESYDEEAVPDAGDIVNIPAGYTVVVSNDSSFAKVSSLNRIAPQSSTSTIIFDVAEDTVRTNGAAIRGTNSSYGFVIKRGKGELAFTSVERFLSGQTCNDYRVGNITVEEGTLRMQVAAPKREYAFETLAISNNATFVLPTKGSTGGGSFFAWCNYLCGEGTVYCQSGTQLRVQGPNEQTFAGAFTGVATYFSNGRVMLTGTNSTTTAGMSAYSSNASKMPGGNGVTGVKKFGMAGEPSSIGKATTFTSDYKGGGFLYLGEGETTDKGLRVNRGGVDGGPSFIDAGAHGGLTFQGTVWGQTEVNRRLETIYLYGSNENACVIASQINNWTYGTTNLAFHLVKRGTGTWRLAEVSKQPFAGAISVEEGTLQVDSIADKGQYSAAGTATCLFEPGYYTFNPDRAVGYAFALGGTNAAGQATTEGVLEYTGTNGIAVWTRPLALRGHGRITTGSKKPFRFRGISAEVAGEHVLTLDGTGTNRNEIADITDGKGIVSVVKVGTGDWTISGSNTFSGDLDVQCGRLTVRNVTATKYTWFLWTVKQICNSKIGGNNEFKVPEFGMFDVASNQVVKGLSYAANYPELAAGQAALYSRGYFNIRNDSLPTWLFNGKVRDDGGFDILNFRDGSWYAISPTKPDTWIPIIFRMKDNAGIVASYDIASMHGATDSDKRGGLTPRTYTLEGSVDGFHWDVLDDVEDTLAWDDWSKNGGMLLPENKGAWAWSWMYTTNIAEVGNTQVHAGKPIRGTTDVVYPSLTNIRSVSVSGGGVLAVEGDTIELSSLSVDCNGGGGTISNFTFAANGQFTVANASADTIQKLPLKFADVGNVAALANWTLAADISCAAKRYRLRVKDGEAYLTRPGIMVSFR